MILVWKFLLLLTVAPSWSSPDLLNQRKNKCEAQLSFHFEDQPKLILQTNRFNDPRLIESRKQQLVRESREQGFVSLSGISNLKNVLSYRPELLFRFLIQNDKNELQLLEGYVADFRIESGENAEISIRRGLENSALTLTDKDSFLVFHPQGPISLLFSSDFR